MGIFTIDRKSEDVIGLFYEKMFIPIEPMTFKFLNDDDRYLKISNTKARLGVFVSFQVQKGMFGTEGGSHNVVFSADKIDGYLFAGT